MSKQDEKTDQKIEKISDLLGFIMRRNKKLPKLKFDGLFNATKYTKVWGKKYLKDVCGIDVDLDKVYITTHSDGMMSPTPGVRFKASVCQVCGNDHQNSEDRNECFCMLDYKIPYIHLGVLVDYI